MRAALALALLASLVAGVPAPSPAAGTTPRLAVLIAAPWPGELSMSQDAAAAALALQRRGFSPPDILVLDGQLSRQAILAFLGTVRQRIASWKSGEILMAVSAHGVFTGLTVSDARPGLLLSAREPLADHMLFWDEIFNALAVPDGVRVVLLPDS